MTHKHYFKRGLLAGLLLLVAGMATLSANAAAQEHGSQPESRISEEQAIIIATGSNEFRISKTNNDPFDAGDPAVAYNPIANEYLVVWNGDDSAEDLVDDENEIFGQRVDAATGQEVGPNDFRISRMGSDNEAAYDAYDAAVTYNPDLNQYLVVWDADDNSGSGLVNNKYEIFGQLLDAEGHAIGPDDFRISYMGIGVNGQTDVYDATDPALVYDPELKQYLVVWSGLDFGVVNGMPVTEEEIFGQRVKPDGTLNGNKFRISDMGPDGNTLYWASDPAVAYNMATHQFLVVWEGREDVSASGKRETEIFGQLLDGQGKEIGSNDFRMSDMGPDGNDGYGAYNPVLAYNSNANQFLVVWQGSDDGAGLANHEIEIFGQLLKADGTQIGVNDFRISAMGPDGNQDYNATNPAVIYHATNNQFLVIWKGDAYSDGDLSEEDIFGQLLNADGTQIGPDDFRISTMGPDRDMNYGAMSAALTYNSTSGQFLVVWRGDDDRGNLASGEYEIFGQVLRGDALEIGADDFRISNMGKYNLALVGPPDVAFNPVANEYLVVWNADDRHFLDYEIYGQRVDAATGLEVGANDFRISDMGPGNEPGYLATRPQVTYNSDLNQYLVVWYGKEELGGVNEIETEIFGQLLDSQGNQIGRNDFRISDMGGPTIGAYGAFDPALTYNPVERQYLVVWSGNDIQFGKGHSEYEIYGQLLRADGTETGLDDFRISDMGPDGDDRYKAVSPDVTFNITNNEYLVVWSGDDNSGSLSLGEYEVYGQLLNTQGRGIGSNDFRISEMGPDGSSSYDAFNSAVVHNPATNQYLVVWDGDDGGLLADNEYEIYGQLLRADGTSFGANDFRISDMGLDGSSEAFTETPVVTYDTAANQYLVVWSGVDYQMGAQDQYEIFGQILEADGAETGENDFHISHNPYDNSYPNVVCRSSGCLTVWRSIDDGDSSEGDSEIFGRMYSNSVKVYVPLVIR